MKFGGATTRCWLLFVVATVAAVSAFSPIKTSRIGNNNAVVNHNTRESSSTSLFMVSEEEKQTKYKSGLDKKMTDKLIKESIAPWRPLRVFLYGSLGSGAFIGGLITLTGTLAALSGARDDLDLNTEYLNLAIDFGAVAIFALLAKFDLDKGNEFDAKVEEKIENVKKQKKVVKQMRAREQDLRSLELDVTVGLQGETQTVPIRDLQQGAKQHMILVIGPRKACKDAMVGAQLLKMDFAMNNVLVVPYETGKKDMVEATIGETTGGFGDTTPIYENQPYIAKAVGDGWDDYIQSELKDAVEQGGDSVKEEGIAIVVGNNGKVLRRGVGKVPWRQMVEQLEEFVKEE